LFYVGCTPAVGNLEVAAIRKVQIFEPLHKGLYPTLRFHIVFSVPHKHADASHPLALLRARRQWPRRRTADERDDLAPPAARHPPTLHRRPRPAPPSPRRTTPPTP